jgi:aldehyde dehydrogenase (NAD+)
MDAIYTVKLRKEKLKLLLQEVLIHEDEIVAALYNDFKKSKFESVVTETSIVISDLKKTINNINSWAKPKKVLPSLLNFPSYDYIISEPYGKVLIIAPWNYPFQLAICPLIAAVAAGNSIVLKPSELTVHTSAIIKKIVEKVFSSTHVSVVEGGIEVSQKLLSQKWDYIFFTGSVPVGKIVAKAAAEYLTPVTLELGGKNPCIVHQDCNIDLSAKKIVWGKFLNAGQTCIAPDYILVHKKIKEKFITACIKHIELAYSNNPEESKDYPRIINAKNLQRLKSFLENEKILYGGTIIENQNYLSPTLLDESKLDSEVMKDEIFGPILPIISYENESEIEALILKYDKPLSLYVFTSNTNWAKKIINKFSFGGGCINDTVIHFSNYRLPFGGVGNSGIGAYHGKLSFDIFSHKKSIVHKFNFLDVPLRYAPYKNKIEIIKKLLNWL